MRKAMIYTSFALIASVLLVSLAFLPVNSPSGSETTNSFRIGQSSFFLDSVMGDMDRSLSMATRRMLTSSTNFVIKNNQELVDTDRNLSSALVNGTISGKDLQNMENVSMNAWIERVSGIASRSGYNLNATLEDYSFNSSSFEVESSYTVFARLEDPVTRAAFNKTETANTTVTVSDLEDPMILLRSKGRYVSKYRRCGFDEPADRIASTGNAAGLERARSVNYPSDASTVSNPGEKVLVVEDVDNHNQADVNDFAAVVAQLQNSTGGYTVPYAFDTGPLPAFEENQTLIVDEGEVWRTDFETMFEEGCYIESDIGPDPIDRLSNDMVNQDGTGVVTLVDVSELPSVLRREDSAVGYVYFNRTDDYGGDKSIKEVSDDFSWFRLDQEHIDRWGINDLVK